MVIYKDSGDRIGCLAAISDFAMIITKLKMWLQRQPGSPRIICVLGMHRSGTSFLTGSLQQAGLELHRFHAENPHNKKGNRENQDIVELNNWLLDSSGGSWDDPPATVNWTEAHISKARDIISQYSHYPLWGFKDPRTLLTFDGWKTLLPNLELVGIFRHPLAVAKSLNARNTKTSIAQGLSLWFDYNSRLVQLCETDPFPLLEFDQEFEQLHLRLKQVCKQLKLPRLHELDFYDHKLISQHETEFAETPAEINSLHQKLQSIAIR